MIMDLLSVLLLTRKYIKCIKGAFICLGHLSKQHECYYRIPNILYIKNNIAGEPQIHSKTFRINSIILGPSIYYIITRSGWMGEDGPNDYGIT